MNEKVVLVNPNRMKPAIAPIALDYLAGALAANGFQVDILDLCFSEDWARDIDAYFNDYDPVAVGVSLRNVDDTTYSSREFFVPGFQERDEGEREKPYIKYPWDGVSGVRPFHELAEATTVGVY